jgi:hypothetical protein
LRWLPQRHCVTGNPNLRACLYDLFTPRRQN